MPVEGVRVRLWIFCFPLTKMLQLLLVIFKRVLTLAPINFYWLILNIDDALDKKVKTVKGYGGIKQQHQPFFFKFTYHTWTKTWLLEAYSVKNVPTSDRSKNRTVVPCRRAQHGLLATPLLLCAQQLCGAGQSPSVLLLHRLGAVDAQRAQLILSLC